MDDTVRALDLLDLLAPPRCLGCASPSRDPLCVGCLAGVRWRRADDDAPPPGSGLARCVTLLWLEGRPVEWIHRFKYPLPGLSGLDGPARRLGIHLARLLGRHLDGMEPGDRVVAVPLHPRRLRARGFNPAAVIARHAFRRSAARPAPSAVVRVRDTPPQAELGRADRRRNVEGAFAWRGLGARPPHRVWLVDDVVTTGATLGAIADTLHEVGVREVFGVALARTPALQATHAEAARPGARLG